MTDQPRHGRRRLLVLLASLPAALRAGSAMAAPARAATVAQAVPAMPFPDGLTLMVAGPGNGAMEGWADAVQPALEQALPQDTAIRRVTVGGPDGVTGANQFEARGVPDGLTVLLVPGLAALAWLVGDPRAQFDVGRWVTVMAGVQPCVVIGRQAAFLPDRPIRIAASEPAGPELPALLGLDLLGSPAAPVFGLGDPAAAQAALAKGTVDAVFLRGRDALSAPPAVGVQPLFGFGAHDDAGKPARDPAFPDTPHLAELAAARAGHDPSGPLYDAWCAAAAATQLEFGLVLPQLTPAAMVALWRRVALDAAATPGVQTKGTSLAVHPVGGPAATACATAVAADATALLELRRWLANRFNWRPRP